jgi:DNA-binding MarR family transcriptional regulator
MKTVSSGPGDVNRRGELHATVRRSLNDAALQMVTLQRRVGARLGMRDADLECYNLIHNEGPLTPGELARRTGVHPATMTGILDRLERAGWISRTREEGDRRATRISALKERNRELFDLLAGMNSEMDDVLHDYSPDELRTIASFLARTTDAGRHAAEVLAAKD